MWTCPSPLKKEKRMEEEGEKVSPPTPCPLEVTSLLHNLVNFGGFPNNSAKCQNKCAVIFDNGLGLVHWLSYKELDIGAEFVKNELLTRRIGGGGNFVGVKCDLGILYPVLVLGILRSGAAFYNIDPDRIAQSVEDGVQYLGVECFVVADKEKAWKGVDKVEEIEIPDVGNNGILRFQLFRSCGDSKVPVEIALGEKLAYAVQTSGTTGRKKSVLVPHTCICPNIVDFSTNLWNVTGKDVIFGAAPPTFDPHVVELFAALMGGASVFYTTPEVKQNASLLAKLLDLHQVSILQITPSLFRRLSIFLSCESSVRLITLGGEKCPEKEELQKFYKGLSGRKIVFQNVYGVTEVSCWASLETIDFSSPDPITIGQGLLDTEVILEPESNEIVIKSSTRRCIIIDPTKSAKCLKAFNLVYRTGDLGRLSKNGIVFLGRKDCVVKRNGMKVSLHHIEQMTLSTGLVTFAQCELHEGKIYLVTKLKDAYSVEGRTEGGNLLGGKLELPLFMYPDHIIALKDASNIPVNGNGKIDLTLICTKFHYENMKVKQKTTKIAWNLSNDRHEIIETLFPIWKSCTAAVYPEQNEDILCQDNFTASGGTSISSVRFIESAFMALKLFGSETHQKWEQTLFTTLMTGNFSEIVELIYKILLESAQSSEISISEDVFTDDLLPETQENLGAFFNNFEQLVKPNPFEFHLMQNESGDSSLFTPVEQLPPFPLNSLQVPPNYASSLQTHRFQLGLCVDASPVIVPSHQRKGRQQLVIIGCHGGVLLCIDLHTLLIVWKQRLPNRIEASVEIHPNSLFAYVGCHDGKLYKVSVLTGDILSWNGGGTRDRDEANADSSPIRSKCAVCCDDGEGEDIVIFVNSANSVYCVDAHALNPIWMLRNSFRFLATVSPVIWRGRCYLATLDRGIVCLNVRGDGGVTLWASTNQDKSEVIYYTPVIFKSSKKTLLICGFTQGMEVREAKHGALLWRQMCSNLNCVQAPLVNSCCGGKLIWIEKSQDDSTWTGKILEVTSGKTLKKLGVPFNCGSGGPIISSVVTQVTSRECFLVCKSSCEGIPQLTFVSLHDMQQREIKIERIPDFETFSKPVCWNEFVLFGGRDNYFYVIRLLK